MGVSKRVQMTVSLPVTVDMLVEIDDEGDAQITGVLSARIDRPTVRAINEALNEDDWDELFKRANAK